MAVSKDLKDLLDFYLFSDIDDKESIEKYLLKVNIDTDVMAENLNDFLKQKQAELKLAKGRKLRENYLEAINNELLKETESEDYSTVESEMISAFRKASGDTEDDKDMKDDLKKIALLKKLTRPKKIAKMNSPNLSTIKKLHQIIDGTHRKKYR
jgi:HD-GYP domain-containing protein (c-di-GMP phosphodiesterase class II)